MIGAIIGDISGSRFEWHNIKTKDFNLLSAVEGCEFTDDSVMTTAITKALLKSGGSERNLKKNTVKYLQKYGKLYPHRGYGGRFKEWIRERKPEPYGSWGNGSAMRVSSCAYFASSLDEAKKLSEIVSAVTHNHPEGIKGAEAVTVAIYMALHGSDIAEIKDYINDNYYSMSFTLDEIRDEYAFDVSCQGSVPQAIKAFLESTDFEDAIRNAISIGGDSDTIAAIAGSIAEAYYGVPDELRKKAMTFLDESIISVLYEFEKYISEK